MVPCEYDIGDSRSQEKRPLGSPSNELNAVDCARLYLMEIEKTFHDQKHKYSMFLEILEDIKTEKRICINAVVKRVKELLKGHNNLILGFNMFLPEGLEMTLDEEEAPPKKKVASKAAIDFIIKIKKRFEHKKHAYNSFLVILRTYQNDKKGITEVYNEISTLFKDHSDLLEEFTRILIDALAPRKDDGGSGN